ncbi:S-adenosyl-L-methionine-dependent methyltransferase [Delitschia confertaspora ATCC 74209]|uniref:S-adenosyl-L-methionine-dependent methyltransferase n=1 Tax=Delitschia confertaspora ATCC 74209 TaxID=1513339 RepID=A0A9P4MV34_9PLEO|nr:S-adenosyl-L-methionine-dependent methyltransferase [Delitschia confertaspora ATCC 74209]
MTVSNGTQSGSNGTENGSTTVDIPLSVALSPNDLKSVPGLVKEVSSYSESLFTNDYAARQKLLSKARALVRALETPRETMIKHCWAQTGCHAALTTCINLNVFSLLASDNGSAKKVADLAKAVKCEEKLLAMGYIVETGPDEYKPTNFSSSLTIPIIRDGYPALASCGITAITMFPEYLIKYGYKTPNDAKFGPYQWAYNTKDNFFEYLQNNPPHGVEFNHHMGGYRQGRPSWMDKGFFPVQEQLIDGAKPERAFLVDVGGGMGHDLMEFHRKHPHVPGQLILQDLPIVIENQLGDLSDAIKPISHNFLEPQPVKGARAYYMHSVLHDWPDDVAGTILKHLIDAMEPGYSKLLINENVIPPKSADWQATALDMMMVTLLSAEERTEQSWRTLLEGAGLRILNIWKAAEGVESLIECEKV